MKSSNHSVHLIRLECLLPDMVKAISHRLTEEKYSNTTGVGFDEVLFDGDYLSATLLKRTPTFIPQYDLSAGKLIDQEFFIYSRIIWGIDTRFAILEVVGPTRNARKLLSAITSYLHPSVQIVPIDLSPSRVIPALIKKLFLQEIQKLTVNNFQYKEGIVGRFEMKVSKTEAATEILEKYPNEVSKAKFLLNLPEVGSVKVSFSCDGHIEVFCDEDDLFKVLSIIKTALFVNETGGDHA